MDKENLKIYKHAVLVLIRTAQLSEEELSDLMLYKLQIKPSLYRYYLKRSNDLKSVINKNREKLEECGNILERNIDKYRNMLPMAKKMVELYILNDEYTNLYDFAKAQNITVELMESYIAILNVCDDSLYDVYLQKCSEKEEQEILKSLEIGKIIINQLQNGVVLENDTTRPFDIIDYYSLIKIKPYKLIEVLKTHVSVHELTLLKMFLRRNQLYQNFNAMNDLDPKYKLTSNEIEQKYQEKIEFNCIKDKDGNTVLGTSRVITEAEKREVISYVQDLGIPLTDSTYYAGIKRVGLGKFGLKEKTNKTLKLTI